MASTVSRVYKVGLYFRAYMGGINCELLDELGNMYVYINIRPLLKLTCMVSCLVPCSLYVRII